MYGIYVDGNIIARFTVPMSVTSNEPVFATDTLSLSRSVYKQGAQRWQIKSNLEPLSFGAEHLFVHSVTNGYSNVFSVAMPQNYGTIKRRAASGVTTTATGTKGSNTITIADSTGLIPKGTFVQVGSHGKVYMTTSDTNGAGSVGVYPRLLANVSGAFSYRDRVLGNFRYDSDTVMGMSYSDGILMDQGSVTLIEDVTM